MTPTPTSPRNAGRPSASLLTSDKITETAQQLMATEGDFTMAKLARALGVAPSSLYNHVTSRDEVLAAISDQVAQGIDTQALQDAAAQVRGGIVSALGARALWLEATERWARSYRQAFSVAPAVVMTLAVTPVRRAPATLAMYEQVTSAFTAFGMSPRQALLTVEAIEAFLLGSATCTRGYFRPRRPSRRTPHHGGSLRDAGRHPPGRSLHHRPLSPAHGAECGTSCYE